MSVTTYQQIEKPLDREQLFELFMQTRLEELGALFGNAHVEGLQVEWVSASSIKVKTGAADFADGSRRLRVTSDITVAGISLGNNAWGHAYLYNNAGVAAAEVVTTAPSNYFGNAYQKSGDASRRYLGSVRTDGSGQVYKFMHDGDRVYYLEVTALSPFRVLSGGTSTVEASVSCSGVVPPTSRAASIRFVNSDAGVYAVIGNSLRASSVYLIGEIRAGTEDVQDWPLDGTQAFTYKFSSAPAAGLYADVRGHRFAR